MSEKDKIDELFKYRYIKLTCIHHGFPRVNHKIKNIRPRQKSLKLGCTFEINLSFLKKKGYYRVSSFVNSDCNHELNLQLYESLAFNRRWSDDMVDKYLKNYKNKLEVKNEKLKVVIYDECQKVVTDKDIWNVKRKFSDEQPNDLLEAISQLEAASDEDSGSYFVTGLDERNSTLEYIFFQTSEMRKALQQFSQILFIDGTYSLNREGYILYPFSVVDNFERTLVVAILIVSDETSFTLTKGFEIFKEANLDVIENIKYVMTDKDAGTINSLKTVLPNSIYLLCQWHIIKSIFKRIHELVLPQKKDYYNEYLQNIIELSLQDELSKRDEKRDESNKRARKNKMKPGSIIKEKLKTLMLSLMKSRKEILYNERLDELKQLCSNNIELEAFYEYFMKNWDSIKMLWVDFIVKSYYHLNSNTNNRSENINRQIKRFVMKHSKFSTFIKKLLEFLDSHYVRYTNRINDSSIKILNPSNVSSEVEELIITQCSKFLTNVSIDRVRNEYKYAVEIADNNFESIYLVENQLSCSLKDGICLIGRMLMPCRHLMATKILMDEPIVDESYFSSHWFKDKNHFNINSKNPESKVVEIKKTNNDRERHNLSESISKSITKRLERFSDNQRTNAEADINKIMNLWDLNTKPVINSPEKDDEEDNEITFAPLPPRIPNLRNNDKKFIKRKRVVEVHDESPKKIKLDIPKSSDNPESLLEDLNSFYHERTKVKWSINDFDILINKNLKASDKFLNDNHFFWAQYLIKNEYPNMKGLEDTQRYISHGFTRSALETYVQPCHVPDSHWLLVSNAKINKENRRNSISIYDSMTHKDYEISPAVQSQISQILRNDCDNSAEETINVSIEPCPQQNNGYDCGIFCIANAVSICLGIDPSSIKYTGNMREEFLKMIKLKKVICFTHERVATHNIPLLTKTEMMSRLNVLHCINLNIELKIICFCRMPKKFGDTFFCEKCKIEYHFKCNFISYDLKNELSKLLCLKCRGHVSLKSGKKLNFKNNEKFKKLSSFISKMATSEFSSIFKKSIRQVKCNGSINIEQQTQFDHIYSTYDLESVSKRKEMFHKLKKSICNCSEIKIKYNLHNINNFETCNLILLTLFLIERFEHINLPQLRESITLEHINELKL